MSMKKPKVKVIIWGLGAMGKGIANMLLKKEGVEIVGVVVRGPKIGKSMFELMDIEGDPKEDVIAGSFEEVIKDNSADIAIICTDSFVKESFDKIKYCIERKINVISTAEEMAYPKAQESKLSEELDNIARENDVTILGTGINPGLIMDLLVIAL